VEKGGPKGKRAVIENMTLLQEKNIGTKTPFHPIPTREKKNCCEVERRNMIKVKMCERDSHQTIKQYGNTKKEKIRGGDLVLISKRKCRKEGRSLITGKSGKKADC